MHDFDDTELQDVSIDTPGHIASTIPPPASLPPQQIAVNTCCYDPDHSPNYETLNLPVATCE